MSNSGVTTRPDQIATDVAEKEAQINLVFDALSPALIYGRRDLATTGLTWGYYGGKILVSGTPTEVAEGTVSLTGSATNYVEATTAGVVSANTSAYTVGSVALYRVTTGSSSITSWIDDRVLGTSSASATIADDSVTNAKLANVATQTIKGRTTASTGDPEDLTAAQAAAVVQGDGLTVDLAGFRGIPQNAQIGNYTLVAADAGKHICHASGAGSGDTYTIPANASVAFPLGTSVTFINMDSNAVSIAITSDTLNLSSAGTTGTRSLAQYGVATAVKVASTVWLISGSGLT